jgi:DNA-binding response OmpR family regulator
MVFPVTQAASAFARTDVLLVDSEVSLASFGSLLASSFQINSTPRASVAVEYIRRTSPSLVVTELALEDGTGLDVCRAAKLLMPPATVLVTPMDPDGVPDALAAGCDGVLLKPFAPNLLAARVGRLLRDRSNRLRLAARSIGKSAHLSERVDLLRSGTNRVWPNTHCPYCTHSGVVSFDFASMRRAWYACLECRKVWMAKRQE